MLRIARIGRNIHQTLINIGNNLESLYKALGNRFEPNGLPDTTAGRIPNAFGLQYLFAARLIACVGRIPN